jgi:outer membrane receptor protein involved in Fe transport
VVTDAVPTFGSGWEREQVDGAAGSPLFRSIVDARSRSGLGDVGAHARLFDRIDATFTTLGNIDRARIHGAECGVALRPPDWLSVIGSWAVLAARDAGTDTPLPRRPRNVARLGGRA